MHRAEFNEFVQQHSRRLYGYAYRILRNQEESEDAVQELFIKLWKMGEQLQQYKSIDALATTMIKNYCIDQWRKKRNLNYEEDGREVHNKTTDQSPYDRLELKESNEILHKIIDSLPDLYKVVVKLRDVEGFSYEEISEMTGQNINTLRVSLSRGRKLIRDEFIKYQYER